MLLFLVPPCLIVAVKPCLELMPIKKNCHWWKNKQTKKKKTKKKKKKPKEKEEKWCWYENTTNFHFPALTLRTPLMTLFKGINRTFFVAYMFFQKLWANVSPAGSTSFCFTQYLSRWLKEHDFPPLLHSQSYQ